MSSQSSKLLALVPGSQWHPAKPCGAPLLGGRLAEVSMTKTGSTIRMQKQKIHSFMLADERVRPRNQSA